MWGRTLESHWPWNYGIWIRLPRFQGFPGGPGGKEPTCQCRRYKRGGFDPWVRKIPWRKKWHPTPIFLPGVSQGKRSLVGYSLWSHKRVGHDWNDLAQTHAPRFEWAVGFLLISGFPWRDLTSNTSAKTGWFAPPSRRLFRCWGNGGRSREGHKFEGRLEGGRNSKQLFPGSPAGSTMILSLAKSPSASSPTAPEDGKVSILPMLMTSVTGGIKNGLQR